jgi:hypothetical protein
VLVLVQVRLPKETEISWLRSTGLWLASWGESTS